MGKRLLEFHKDVSIRRRWPVESVEDAILGSRYEMKSHCRSSAYHRDIWSRDTTPPQGPSRDSSSTHALISAESTVKMALTCKVQYLDDTDPFASTNFPEPTRPPTYTFHLNIPLFQQIAGLHRLLSAPHNVRGSFVVYTAFHLNSPYHVVLWFVSVRLLSEDFGVLLV